MLHPIRPIVRTALSALLLLAAISPGTKPASAQADPSAAGREKLVQLAGDDARTFRKALAALAAQARVAFVAEGEPLHPTLPADKTLDLPPEGAPLSRAVEDLAAAFDYTATPMGDVFVLKKRYSDPRGLPSLTLEEGALVIQDIRRVIAPLNPRVPPQHFVRGRGIESPKVSELMRTLTPAQLRLMREKKLHVSLLSPRQKALVRRFALHYYVQFPVERAESALKLLEGVVRSDPVFRWGQWGGSRVFGLEIPVFGLEIPPGGQRTWFIPLNGSGIVTLDASLPLLSRRRIGPNGEFLPFEDPTDPASEAATTAPEMPPAPSTLGQVVATLNARGGSPRAGVDAALADKVVTVTGEETLAPTWLLAALAQVYGLRVKTEADGTLLLTRPLWRAATVPATLPEAVRRVIPEPALRASRVEELNRFVSQRQREAEASYFRRPPPTAPLPSVEEQQRRRAEWSKQLFSLQEVPARLRIEAVRRLRAAIEPKLKAAPDGRVPLSTLGRQERMALANALLTPCLMFLGQMLNPDVPGYIARLDEVVLTGGVYEHEGRKKFSLFLSLPTPDGSQVLQQVGVTNVK